MDLSMLIKENTAFDSTGAALKEFAIIELLLYQNKTQEALQKISVLKKEQEPASSVSNSAGTRADSSKKGTIVRPSSMTQTSSILDDIYWLEANLRMKQGEFEKSIALLQKILDFYGDDILADDAYFLQGEIYERQLHNKEKAMEIYRTFLDKFPGSVYAAEARKRYRMLRGDFGVQPNP